MPAPRRKAIALLTTAAGLGILLVAGVMLYRPLEERYWLWKLREGDESEKERAADRLAELEVEEAVPILIGLMPRQRVWTKVYEDLNSPPYWMRTLVKFDELAAPHLRDVLKETLVAPRIYAVFTLGEIGPAAIDAIPELLGAVCAVRGDPCFDDNNPEKLFSVMAGYALGKISPDARRQHFRLFH